MTLRYRHLSPGHQLDAVQRLVPAAPTGTATGTSNPAREPATHVSGATGGDRDEF